MIQDAESILQAHYTYGGCGPLVSWPYSGTGASAAVLEFDSDLTNNNGYTIREPDSDKSCIIQTNHFRVRIEPMDDCPRYNLVNQRMEEIQASRGQEHLTTDGAWELLKETPIQGDGSLVLYSVVFEPNQRLMHVAFAQPGIHAPFRNVVTLDVVELLERNEANNQ